MSDKHHQVATAVACAVINSIASIAANHGATLKTPESLLPLNVDRYAKSDFSRGVLTCVLHVLFALSQTAQGRQAILDLGYQPLFEDVKSPRAGGLDD